MKTREYRFPPDRSELERRWKLVQKEMRKKNVTLIIATSLQAVTGGYVRYLSGFAVDFTYISPNSVLLPVDDEPYIITTGNPTNPFDNQDKYILPPTAEPGVKYLMREIYYPCLNFTHDSESELFVKPIKHRGDKKVGLVGLANFSQSTIKYLEASCPDVEFCDFTAEIDQIKAIKSTEEIGRIRKSAKIHDYLMQAVPSLLRSGMYEWEISAKLTELANDLGSENPVILVGSGRQGTQFSAVSSFYQNRQLAAGDQISIVLRCSGPGGYFSILGRNFMFGVEASPETKEAVHQAIELQHYAGSLLKPGTKASQVRKLVDEKLAIFEEDLKAQIEIYGQGYDIVERPFFAKEEDFIIQEGMNIAVHATLLSPKACASVADSYLITSQGSELLHVTPREIAVI